MQNDDEKQKAIEAVNARLMEEIQKVPLDDDRIMRLLDELTILQVGVHIPEEPDLSEEEIQEIINSRKNSGG